MPKLVVFSGAGLSAESGLATFRGKDGLWNGSRIDQICDWTTWKANFKLVHEFYNARRVELGRVEPNVAHFQMAQWQERFETVYLTQNVDDLLERAGCKNVVHLHGFLTEMQCTACGHIWDIGYQDWQEGQRCPNIRGKHVCGSIRGVKPNVRLFHEICPNYRTLYHTCDNLKQEDVVIVTGTSSTVLPFHTLLSQRAGFKIINALEESSLDNGLKDCDTFDIGVYEPATKALPMLDAFLSERLRKDRWVQ